MSIIDKVLIECGFKRLIDTPDQQTTEALKLLSAKLLNNKL